MQTDKLRRDMWLHFAEASGSSRLLLWRIHEDDSSDYKRNVSPFLFFLYFLANSGWIFQTTKFPSPLNYKFSSPWRELSIWSEHETIAVGVVSRTDPWQRGALKRAADWCDLARRNLHM